MTRSFLRALLGAALLGAAPAQGPPAAPPTAWRSLLGEYGPGTTTRVMILERGGALIARFDSITERRLSPRGARQFRLADSGIPNHTGTQIRFRTDPRGRATAVVVFDSIWARRAVGPEDGAVFRIVPTRPVETLRREALAASPPAETGAFRPADLVELLRLDSTIRLDIRYAGTRNFLGVPVYSQARAFLQGPAAEALVRAHHWLRSKGYGLLIHDGYRPWYVTKLFWDATPESGHEFVADPAQGSRHNRGCAVDLTLYDRKTGRPVEMPGVYDEMSHRSYPGYPGGTSRQRWHRDLLRRAMEAEGFTVNSSEWWHFDYQDWKSYRIGNTRFEDVSERGAPPRPTRD